MRVGASQPFKEAAEPIDPRAGHTLAMLHRQGLHQFGTQVPQGFQVTGIANAPQQRKMGRFVHAHAFKQKQFQHGMARLLHSRDCVAGTGPEPPQQAVTD